MKKARLKRDKGQNGPLHFGGRVTLLRLHNTAARAARRGHGAAGSKRARGGSFDVQLPFAPPENWHEPSSRRRHYRVIVQPPGEGYRHVVTAAEIREHLSALPQEFLQPLEIIQLSAMTRKKQSLPCYGMQWGAALYLYPMEESLVEYFDQPPRPSQVIEARMYGGRLIEQGATAWKLVWSEAAIRDFYLNNILIHELGHLLDNRNSSYVDRERFAEWFALRYGRRPSGSAGGRLAARRRHHRRCKA